MSNVKDLTGTKIGKLEILERKREKKRTWYYCKCECGNDKWLRDDFIKSHKHCGCERVYPYRDLSNKKFGMLTAIEVVGASKNNGNIWRCRCDCGNTKDIPISHLISESVVSCGCYQKGKAIENIKKARETFQDNNVVDDTNISYLMLEKPIKSNNSGVTGVFFDQRQQKWTASISFKRKRYYLGSYNKKEDAIIARKKAEEKLHKKFLREKGLI